MFHGGFIGIGISLCWALKVWYIPSSTWTLSFLVAAYNSHQQLLHSINKLNTRLSFTYIPTSLSITLSTQWQQHTDDNPAIDGWSEVFSWIIIYFCPPQRVKFPKLSKEVYLDQCWSVMLCSSLSNSSNSPHVSVFGVFLIKAVPPYTQACNSAASCGPKRKIQDFAHFQRFVHYFNFLSELLHNQQWQWPPEGYIWNIKFPANRILLPWKINRSFFFAFGWVIVKFWNYIFEMKKRIT
jgi:hypothetical protein